MDSVMSANAVTVIFSSSFDIKGQLIDFCCSETKKIAK